MTNRSARGGLWRPAATRSIAALTAGPMRAHTRSRIRLVTGLVVALAAAGAMVLAPAVPSNASTISNKTGVASWLSWQATLIGPSANSLLRTSGAPGCNVDNSVDYWTGNVTLNRQIAAITPTFWMTSGTIDQALTQTRLDRWDGSKWVTGWGWGAPQSSTLVYNGAGLNYLQPGAVTWNNLPSGYYKVVYHHWFYKNSRLVGEAWETPTQADYWLTTDGAPDAWIGATGATAAGWCVLP
jgi:hypothetical protein